MEVKSLLSQKKTILMGILNITPDSFSDAGKFLALDDAIMHAKQMVEDGADIIDIGGESSRPGGKPITEEEELHRVLPVIRRLRKEIAVPISIDTSKPLVAEEACKLGMQIINDTHGFIDDAIFTIAKKYQTAIVIMHNQKITNADSILDIKTFLHLQAQIAKKKGITTVIIDPGLGFGKSVEDNILILKRLHELLPLGYPILIGPSKKTFLGNITDLPVWERGEASLAAAAIGVYNGASIVRVHDVKETKRAMQVVDAIKREN